MCIAAWAWECYPARRLLLLFNRDEYHSRFSTQPVQWWSVGEDGGRDELGGGTWMGCTRDGKLAFLTNVGAKTRGELPESRSGSSSHGPLEYAAEISKEADQYNGFNLILADVNSGAMVYISNRPGSDPAIQTVAPGLHVLSNAAIDSPWPKARYGTRGMAALATKLDGEVTFYERYLESNLWKENLVQFQIEKVQ